MVQIIHSMHFFVFLPISIEANHKVFYKTYNDA